MVEGNLFLHFSKWMFSKEKNNQLFVLAAVLFCNIGAFAQTIVTVSVIDSNGEALIGVNE